MTSKEYIQGVLYNLKETLKFAEETNNKDLELDCKMQIESYNQVLIDLGVLEQLKEILSMDYLVSVCGFGMAKRLQTYLKSNDIVKEWLENE